MVFQAAMHKFLTGPLTIESLTIPISNLSPPWQGAKVVQLSDFHYDGVRLSDTLLYEAIEAINAIEPALIVLTGDFVTDEPEVIHTLVQHLKHLQSQHGIYAVLGNHDLYFRHSRPTVTEALESIGIQVLWNRVAYPQPDNLAIVGLADFWSREFQPAPVFAQIPTQIPRLVLSHNPDSAAALQSWRVDLQLSGHTHGGQIALPGLKPFPAYMEAISSPLPRWLRRRLPYIKRSGHRVVRHWEWSRGLHSVGSNLLYVNRGLGTYYPGRFRCPPEVTVLTLVTHDPPP